MRKNDKFLIGVFGAIIILLAILVFAADTDLLVAIGNFTTALPNSVEDVSFFYNITLNNTATVNSTFNVSGVSVTFPTGCSLTSGTNASTFGLAGNTSRAYFSTSGSTLNWTNVTYLIRNSSIGSAFANVWFNLSCITPGAYNMLINLTVGAAVNQSSRPFQVNDTETADDIKVASQGTGTANIFGFYEDFQYRINVEVNLTALNYKVAGGVATNIINVTKVNITLPTGCSANMTSNASTKTGTLSSSGQVLSWTANKTITIMNNTDTADVNQNTSLYSINITCTTPANASLLTVTTLMGGDVINTTTLTLHINDFSGIGKGVALSVNSSTMNTSFDALTFYNFSIQNTGINSSINITNVTIISPFTILGKTNGTDIVNTTVTINTTTNTIHWYVNSSIQNKSLVENGTTRYFWFNASASGNAPNSFFNITIQVTNATGQFEYNMSTMIRAMRYELPAAAAASDTSSAGTTIITTDVWTKTVVVTNEQLSAGTTQELKANERATVTISGATHSVGVKEVTATTAKIKVESTPQEATLNIGDKKNFDVTGDGKSDLSVKLNSITSNKASLTIKTLTAEEQAAEQAAAEEQKKAEEAAAAAAAAEGKSIFSSWIFWLIVIIVIAAVAYFIYKKKSK